MSLTLLYIEALGDYCSVRVLSFVNFYRSLCIFLPLVRLSVQKYMIWLFSYDCSICIIWLFNSYHSYDNSVTSGWNNEQLSPDGLRQYCWIICRLCSVSPSCDVMRVWNNLTSNLFQWCNVPFLSPAPNLAKCWICPCNKPPVSVKTYPPNYQWQRAIVLRASHVATPWYDWDRSTRRLPSGLRFAPDEAYSSPAWSGFITATDRQRVDTFLSRSKRCGFCPPDLPDFNQLLVDADDHLFEKILNNPHHTLYHLLPPQSVASQNYKHV